jgi:hypothetical protein
MCDLREGKENLKMQIQKPTAFYKHSQSSETNFETNPQNKTVPADPYSDDELPTIEFPTHGKLKASSWRIHQKIGYGYFLAIGIGFFGSVTGLIIANFYRGQEIRQLMQADRQSQLLANYKDATLRAQLHSLKLPALIQDSQKLQAKKIEFSRDVEKAEKCEQEITEFISNQKGLTPNSESVQALLNDYAKNLKSYVGQIESILQEIETKQQLQPLDLVALQSELMEVMRGETAVQLDELSQKLINALQIAEDERNKRNKDVEEAKIVERAIAIVSMLASVAVAAIVAWRTSRAIAEPVIIVTQVAEQVARKSNFDLRAPVTTEDEIGQYH